MTPSRAEIAFGRLPSAPDEGTVQFYDGYFPTLGPGTYTISVAHALDNAPSTVPTYSVTQTAVVQAPEFTIDPSTVQSVYPAAGATGVFDQDIAQVVLTDPTLPWERALIPGAAVPSASEPNPWLALVVFAEGEIYLAPEANTPVATTTVSDLLSPSTTVLKPQLPTAWVSPQLCVSQCQTITIPGTSFAAVVPQAPDLPLLTHCRSVSVPGEAQVLVSVLLGNRLLVADTRATPAAPVKYYAHVISLEGFAPYLGPNGQPIPAKEGGSGAMDVQLVSLYAWSFTADPETGESFEALVQSLIDSQEATGGLLRLPVPETSLPAAASARLTDGYAPLAFVAGSGDETFAWYRSPLTPVVAQPLPQVGEPPVDVGSASTADALMIYLAEQGLFDLTYAAAWNIGRQVALADPRFARDMRAYRARASAGLARLARARRRPHLGGSRSSRELLLPNATRRHFSALVGAGLGDTWSAALARARQGGAPAAAEARPAATLPSATDHRALLDQLDTVEALAEHLQDQADPLVQWLTRLACLHPLPFSSLVPNPQMLPTESIRFFYIDAGWVDALTAGALSIGVHNGADVAVLQALAPTLREAVESAGPAPVAGMLIRSQLISAWPSLVVSVSDGGAPVPIVRDTRLSPSVRMWLFGAIPDQVTIAEPYQGLQFGVEDQGVAVRNVTTAGSIGDQIPGVVVPAAGGFDAFVGEFCRDGGVIDVAKLAAALGQAAGATAGLGGADMAIQLVRAPESQTFPEAAETQT